MSIVDDYKSINASSSRRQLEADKYEYYTVRYIKGRLNIGYIANSDGEIGLLARGYDPATAVAYGPWWWCDANGNKAP